MWRLIRCRSVVLKTHTRCRSSFRHNCSSLCLHMNPISEPIATISVAIKPIAVPSLANPRNVNAANPKVMDRYALRKKSRKRPSGSALADTGCSSIVLAIVRVIQTANAVSRSLAEDTRLGCGWNLLTLLLTAWCQCECEEQYDSQGPLE
jgi:hypothetical protein